MGSVKDRGNPIPYSFKAPFSVHGIVSQALGLDKKKEDKPKDKKGGKDDKNYSG